MIQPITVRNLTIGSGIPKIIVPIVEDTSEGVENAGALFVENDAQAIEWRVDFFKRVLEPEAFMTTLQRLREVVGETPLLVSFRTKKEGGEREITPGDYLALCQMAAKGGADMVDVEILSGDKLVADCIKAVHEAGALVVASNHDFHGTPKKVELIRRLRKMQKMGADILKIAVMPNSTADVLTLLSATDEMAQKYANKPLITMSMSPRGVLSRLTGEVFGSSMTFGTVGKESAPGQIPAKKLSAIMQELHQYI